MNKYKLTTKDNLHFIVIDYQERLFNIMDENSKKLAVHSWKLLLNIANSLEKNIIYTQQYTKGIGETIPQLKELIQGRHIEKIEFSVCDCEDFISILPKNNTDTKLIIGGMETHICVYQSTLDILEKGYQVYVVADACIARNQQDHQMALRNLAKAGAIITTAETIAMQLVREAKGDFFKQVSGLLKIRPS